MRMDSFREVIRAWPDTATLAEDIGARTKTVRQWLFRDRIPAPFWSPVSDAARKRRIPGVTVERLASLGATGRAPAAIQADRQPERVA